MPAPSRSPSPSGKAESDDETFILFRPFLALLNWVAESVIWYFYLKGFQVGCFEITFPDGHVEKYGDVESDFRAVIVVHNKAAFRRMMLGESVGLAEAYMRGEWDSPDLARMVEVVAENVKARAPVGPPFPWLIAQIEGFVRWVGANTPIISLNNVQKHYDIGNEMYKLMLDDETMSYTCALFRDPELQGFRQFPDDKTYRSISLGQAQLNKIHYVIKKAGITSEDEVVELGCGWGGFAIEAALTTGCKIRSYNLSIEQIKYARAKAKRLGVDHLVTFVHDDYRSATGPVDKVVSIGMFEHVGDAYFPTFFKFVESLLKPHGTAVIHTITSCDSEYPIYKKKGGFMQEYIFPGCCIPAVSAIISAMGTSRLELQHFDNIGEHYALTLRGWRENFYRNIKKVEALPGSTAWPRYNERFQRMWDFYLANCEAEFTTGHFGLAQFIFRAPSKDYRGKAIDEFLPRLPSLYQAPGVLHPDYATGSSKTLGKKRR